MDALIDRLQREIDALSSHRLTGHYQLTRDMKIAVLKDFRDKVRSEMKEEKQNGN